MKHARSILALLMLCQRADVFAQQLPQTFVIDAAHSSIVFRVPFMGMSTVTGEFQEFAGALLMGATPEQSSVHTVIRTKSIATHSTTRDNHLRSPDFFAADSFPLITFQSTRIVPAKTGWIAQGLLNMRGVSRVVELPFVQLQAPMKDAWGNTRVTYHATQKLSRADFNIRGTAFWNSEFDPGRFAVADTVTIDLEVSATIPNTARWNIPKTDSLAAAVEAQGVARVIAALEQADSAQALTDNQVFTTAYKLTQRGHAEDGVRLIEWGLGRFRQSRMLTMVNDVLGDTQLRLGRRAEAIESFKRALALDAEDPVASLWLRHLRVASLK